MTNAAAGERLPTWTTGLLDIHHISTGSGNATLFVCPDGTTMLFDAGDVDREAMKKFAPLKVRDPKPNGGRRAGEWIAEYVKGGVPAISRGGLDYAIISHFHSDHFGKVSKKSALSKTGAFRLSGITDVGESVRIARIVDRAFPGYQIPVDLRACDPTGAGTLSNYIKFVEYSVGQGMKGEAFVVGKLDQILLQHAPTDYPSFHIRNLSANGEVWTGAGEATERHIPWDRAGGCSFNENPFSIALKIQYGAFAYYTGGDTTGLAGKGIPPWFDVETPLSKVVGVVDVMTLNHHGNRDATNEAFLGALRPRVIIQQSWISDQPGGEVFHRMISQDIYAGPRDIFSTGIVDETRVALGPWMENAYRSFEGHIVVRVQPGGRSYEVFVLDDTTLERTVRSRFGPYISRGN